MKSNKVDRKNTTPDLKPRKKRQTEGASEETHNITPYLNQIIHGDCLHVMREMPAESVDLIVTSPPYNLKNSTGNGMKENTQCGKWASAALRNGYTDYDDNMPHEEYVTWQRACLTEMFRLLKNDGAIFYNHKWRVQDGKLQDRQDIVAGFPVRQIIIWRRKGGINFNPGYFLPTYEVIYLIAKPNFKLAKHAVKFGDVWEFEQEMGNSHPAPFPVELIKKIIGSTNAQIVFDPFMGSGTTAVAAVELGRNYIGAEISEQYCKDARLRIAVAKPEELVTILRQKFEKIKAIGWVPNFRPGNSGGIGNTLESLLGIEENNIQTADTPDWELKTQRNNTASPTTLFHFEPSPRDMKFIQDIFVKSYGWRHKEAGAKYSDTEKSFRQTLCCNGVSEKGFTIEVDSTNRTVRICFDANKVSPKQADWLNEIKTDTGLPELSLRPYWDFDDLKKIVEKKLKNCLYVKADSKKIDGFEFFQFTEARLLRKFSFDMFIRELEAGNIVVDLDARTGHNHGTKFRLRPNRLENLYETVDIILQLPAHEKN